MASPTPHDASLNRPIAFLALAAFAAQSMVRVSDSMLPQIAADFAVTIGAAAIVVTAYSFSHGAVQLVIGPLGDRFGKYLCAGLACAAATVLTFLCGLAGTLPALVAARLACGLSAGWIIPMALAYIGDVVPFEQRQAVIGRFLAGQVLGQLFGQAAGGVLGDFFGWRQVFFFLAALFALATTGVLVEFARNPRTHAASAPPGRSVGFIAGYTAVLRQPWARFLIVVGFFEFALVWGAFAYVGADLHLRFGLNFSIVGLFVGAFAVGGLIYAASVRRLLGRLGPVRLAASGGVTLAVAFTIIALEPVWWTAPLAICGVGLGFYMLHNTLQTYATQMAPQARGTAVGIFSSSLYLGQTAGVAVAAFVFDRHGGAPVFLAAGFMLLMLALWFSRQIAAKT